MIAGLLALKFIVIDTILRGGGWWAGNVTLTPAPLLNFQVATALVVTAGLAFVHWLLGRSAEGDAQRDERTPIRVGFAATLVLLWAGTLEIDRMVASGVFPGAAVWPAWQLKNFAWSAWWAAGITGFIAIVTRRDETLIHRVPMLRMLAGVPIVLAIKYLILDTLGFPPLPWPGRRRRRREPADVRRRDPVRCAGTHPPLVAGATSHSAGAIAMIMLLWLGSLEIDRAFERSMLVMGAFKEPAFAKHVALSIFWSAFAIGCIVAGFRFRTAGPALFRPGAVRA